MTRLAPNAGRYRIAEVARMTGFAPTTLRYYEQAGVIQPPKRTAAGYRTYDDRDVERLRLIARAKELGCSLEEIAELVTAWDDDECGPVKHRLRSLVSTKAAEVQRLVAEQVAFAAQLQETAAQLDGRPVDGPCDDTCGCAPPAAGAVRPAPAAPGRAARAASSAAGAASPPIACTLAATDMSARVADWASVLTRVEAREAIGDGVRLVFGPSPPLADIARLAAAEQECCAFFAFNITIDGRGVALEVTAPPEGQALLTAVFGASA